VDLGASQKNTKIEFLKLLVFFSKIIDLSACEALIYSIWTRDEKIMDNLVFQEI